MWHWTLLCLPLAGLGGCLGGDQALRSSTPVAPVAATAAPANPAPTASTGAREGAGDDCRETWMRRDDMHLSLISQLVDQGALHAGMAHIEGLPPELRQAPLTRYLEAEILRRTGATGDAVAVYESLLGGCLAGAGEHGLGLIAARAGNLDAALQHLRAAKRLLPTQGRIRNDLGYALFLRGDHAAAEREFVTAIELEDFAARAVRNLVLMFYQQGDIARAEAYARRYQMPDSERLRLRQRGLQGRPEEAQPGGQSPSQAGGLSG